MYFANLFNIQLTKKAAARFPWLCLCPSSCIRCEGLKHGEEEVREWRGVSIGFSDHCAFPPVMRNQNPEWRVATGELALRL